MRADVPEAIIGPAAVESDRSADCGCVCDETVAQPENIITERAPVITAEARPGVILFMGDAIILLNRRFVLDSAARPLRDVF